MHGRSATFIRRILNYESRTTSYECFFTGDKKIRRISYLKSFLLTS